ncbi:PAS domain S-box protein [Candidatus Peregrinibacteria bacterium]|nr:PAS domain S-box protein [Candidatus Peregrinibacteria bacterium]
MHKEIETLFGGRYDSVKMMEAIEKKFPNSIWVIDAALEENIAWISSAVSMQRGYSPEEVMDQSLSDIFTEESLNRVYAVLQEEHEYEKRPDVDKDRIRTVELEMKCKDGTTIWTENQVSFLYDENETLIAFLGVTKDITEKKLAEDRQELAIRILECLNADTDIYETIDDITTMIRESLKINGVLLQLIDDDTDNVLYSYTSMEEETTKNADSAAYACSLCARKTEIEDHPYIEKTPQGSAWLNAFDILHGDNAGDENDLPLCLQQGYRSMAMIPIQSKQRIHGVLQMWSEREKMFNENMVHYFERLMASMGVALEERHMQQELETQEEAMRHMQRIESVGQLAGGVAHDFNNLITVIKGFGETLLNRDDISLDAKEDIIEIQKAAHRAARLTKQLLAFSRKQILSREALEINEVFVGMHEMLKRLIEKNITISINTLEKPLFVEADKTQLEQVIMNLAVNARDAMPEGGSLDVTMCEKTVHREYVHNHEQVKPGKYVSIRVKDTGMGIPKKRLNAIFEPFYTTKSVSQGSGLGLSVVYGIVRQHNGHIMVESTEGEGTVFELLLPAHKPTGALEYKTVEEKEKHDLSGKTIFFIEDDIAVRKIVSRILQRAGAHVVIADDIQTARKLFEEREETFDIVFSDVSLPDGNGPDFLQEICKGGYDGPVLLTSGYTFDAKIHGEGCNGKEVPFMDKPFSPNELLLKISSLIKEKK